MKPTKWQKIVSLVILAGVLMKLFDVPYGKEVFTAGFGGYLLMKLVTLLTATRIRFWTVLHFVQFTLILLAMTGLTFMYLEYPYSRVLFALALLAEALVALRIKVNAMFGSQNVSNILRLVSRMVLSRQSRPSGR